MPGQVMRGALALIGLLALWLLLLGWAGGVETGDPWSAEARKAFPGGKAKSVFGDAQMDGDAMRVDDLSDNGAALQAWRLPSAMDADAFGILHFRISDFPRNLDVAFFFRRADQPRQVFSVPLPMPGDGDGSIDLSRIDEWQKEIVEIGLSQYPTAEALREGALSAPFVIHGLRLESRSWRGLLDALGTGWWTFTPWDQRSINVLEPVAGQLAPTSVVLVAALGTAGSALLLLGVFGWRRGGRWRWQLVFTLALLGWLLLDVRWLAAMATRHDDTASAYADHDLRERIRLQADADLIAFAAQVRATIGDESAGRRVLLWSESRFVSGRLGYHLRPLNVANLSRISAVQEGWLLVVEDPEHVWHYDSRSGLLRGPKRSLRADRLLVDGALALYRLGGAR